MLNKEEDYRHEITIEKLEDLIQHHLLKSTDILVPNAVQNLAIIREGEYIGFIDIGSEELSLWENR